PVGGRASEWPRPISRVCLTVITGQCRSGLPRASTFGRSRCGDRRRTPLPAGLPPRIAVATCGCTPRRRAAGARPDPPLGPRVTFPLAGAVILLPPARVHAPWRAAPDRGGRHRPHGTGPAGLPRARCAPPHPPRGRGPPRPRFSCRPEPAAGPAPGRTRPGRRWDPPLAPSAASTARKRAAPPLSLREATGCAAGRGAALLKGAPQGGRWRAVPCLPLCRPAPTAEGRGAEGEECLQTLNSTRPGAGQGGLTTGGRGGPPAKDGDGGPPDTP